MRRRTCLAALPTLALAGCSTNDGSDGDGDDGGDGGNRTPQGAGYDYFREVRIDEVDQGDLADTPLSASVNAEHRRITAEQTTKITVRIENDGTEPMAAERPRCPPTDLREGVRPDGGTSLLLLRDGEFEGDNAAGTSDVCWRPSHFDLNRGAPCRIVSRTLDPGETWTATYRLWDGVGNRECFPPGPYVFESPLAAVDPSAVGTTSETATAGTAADPSNGSATGRETTAPQTTPPTTAPRTTAQPPPTWSFTVGMYDPGMAPTTTGGE